MKRILFMHQSSLIGGGSYCLLNILKTIDRSLFEPVVCLKDAGPLQQEIEKKGIKVVFFHGMAAIPYNQPLLRYSSIKSYWNIISSQKSFKQLLVTENVDVLYLNNMMLYPYLKTAKAMGLKTVIHVREHWPLDMHKKQLSWARNTVYENADKVIAINKYSASIFPQSNATIVYDWIDMSNRFEPMPFDDIFEEDTSHLKVLLFTGGFDSMKGCKDVVDAFTHHLKDENFRLLILGGNYKEPQGVKHLIKLILMYLGREYYDYELKRMIKNDFRIKCIPSTYYINDLVKQSYAFVSFFSVPHANLALAENIIMGNACLAARTEESIEYTGGGEYALLAKFGDFNDFSNKLLELVNNHDFWEKKAIEGSVKLKRMFSTKTNSETLFQELSSISGYC